MKRLVSLVSVVVFCALSSTCFSEAPASDTTALPDCEQMLGEASGLHGVGAYQQEYEVLTRVIDLCPTRHEGHLRRAFAGFRFRTRQETCLDLYQGLSIAPSDAALSMSRSTTDQLEAECQRSGFWDAVSSSDSYANEPRDEYGRTELHYAADGGHMDLLGAALTRGAGVNSRDELGRLPLHGASWQGHVEVVELLLANGSLVDVQQRNGNTPLHEAAQNRVISKLLVAAGANPNIRNVGGLTPLHYAVNSVPEAAQVLLSAGADVNARNDRSETPLHKAAESDYQLGVVQLREGSRAAETNTGSAGSLMSSSTSHTTFARFNTHNGPRARRASDFLQTALSKVTRQDGPGLNSIRRCAGSPPIESHLARVVGSIWRYRAATRCDQPRARLRAFRRSAVVCSTLPRTFGRGGRHVRH